MSIGRITVDLVAKTGAFDTNLDRSAKLAEKRAKEIDAAIRKAGTALGVGLAAIGTASAVWLKQTIDGMDQLSKAAQKVGLPTEDLSKLNYAAGLADVSLETLANSMGKLTKSQAAALKGTSEQAKIFEALGISVKGADGNLRRSSDVLSDFADKFSVLDGSPEAMAAGFAVFGKSFQDMIPLLAGGSQGIKEAGEELDKFGGVISTQAGKNAEEFNDNLTRLQVAASALGAQVATNLLPDLVKLTDNLVQLTKDGNAAAEVADFIRSGFQVLSGAAVIVTSTVRGVTADLIALANAGSAAWSALTGDWKGAAEGIGRAREARAMAAAESQDIANVFAGQAPMPRNVPINFAGRDPEPTGLFRKSSGQLQAEADAARLQKQLRDALSKTGGRGAKKSGKSDAEREAEKVAKATREMTDAQRAWQTELDGTGNAIMDAYSKRLDEITAKSEKYKEQGVPTEQVQKFGEEMRKLADQLKGKELAEFQEEFEFATQEIAAAVDDNVSPALNRYKKEVKEVEALLKSGAISQELYADRISRLEQKRGSDALNLRKDYEFELELLGKTREEQELLIEARRLGADAAELEGRAAIQALLNVQAARKATDDQITIMDGLRDSTRGLFADLKDGIGVWDSLTNAANRFADVIFDVAAKNIAESLFGQTGSTSGGMSGGWLSKIFGAFSGGGGGSGGASTGGGWATGLGSIFGAIFGGARASGGGVWPESSFLVGERGPELFVPRTAGTVLPAQLTRQAMYGAEGNRTVNQTFVTVGEHSRRTDDQRAQKAGREARRALARN